MKILAVPGFVIITLLFVSACGGNTGSGKNSKAEADTISVPDTGFTGILKGMSGRYIVNEITFNNGIRDGLMKTFYQSGKVRVTFWYVNGLRQDSARWYFEEGQLFRTTPYKNDTVDGIQKQFYRTGKLKARIGYSKGLRTPFFQEFTTDGKLVGGYPDVIVTVSDDYNSKGIYRINLGLSDKSEKVRFYKGDLSGGVFDTAHCEKIKTIKGVASINLKKTGSPKSDYVGVIAEILTNYGNNTLVYKKIELPYNDLN